MYSYHLYFLGYFSGALMTALFTALDLPIFTELIVGFIIIILLQFTSFYLTKN